MQGSEIETIINYTEGDDYATIYTASKVIADKLKRNGLEPYDVTKCGKRENGWFFKVPDHAVIIKPARRSIRLRNKQR